MAVQVVWNHVSVNVQHQILSKILKSISSPALLGSQLRRILELGFCLYELGTVAVMICAALVSRSDEARVNSLRYPESATIKLRNGRF